ncbi:MAG: isochorismatase family protein [Bacteroidales bacterium]|jgi:nicotinamidase-related amidase|nr:isochorismatase family protein [Bacteroidales bacterium]NCD09829.1 isochorismatase family protein [Negativicutes bacterium]MDD2771486.1 isochorismatase family protein [Bacteroidales bacterium]MDD3105706.1 isochorismatase family protein [Bacteroidales bacterium]MDD3550366.1 isochorismatase family protein [Bacteroidales bacterium]
MKKITIIITILFTIVSGNLFSQDGQEQTKTQIKPALLIIDIQNVYLGMVPEREKEIGMYFINNLIGLFRSNGYPVIRIYHQDDASGAKPGTELFEYPASVLIKDEDVRVIKTYPNSFNKTDLDKILREQGSNTIFLCGFSAVGCVLSTWVGAQDKDYNAFMVKDAIMSHDPDYTNHVEEMFNAVGYDAVKLILESSGPAAK